MKMTIRTVELLTALSKVKPGLLCFIESDRTVIETLYEPRIRCSSPTLIKTALLVAAEIFPHPDCPFEVWMALEIYEHHTEDLGL